MPAHTATVPVHFSQSLLDVWLRCLPGWNEAKQHTGQERRTQSESEHAIVEAYLVNARKVPRLQGEQSFQAERAKHEADPARKQCQYQAFHNNLAHDANPPSPQGGPQGEFLFTRFRTCEQQTRCVGAGYQQHQTDGAKECQDGWTHVLHEIAVQRMQVEPNPGILVCSRVLVH
jgi:hypothetical protein